MYRKGNRLQRKVALRKESVDRNKTFPRFLVSSIVALRKESVDRNAEDWLNAGSLSRSLSARRAWIEMLASRLVDMSAASLSARRAWIEMEGPAVGHKVTMSLSARRAWIEMVSY